MFSLVNLTKVSTAAHPMYFQVSVPTRISTDPGHGTRILLDSPTPKCHGIRSLLIVLFLPKL